MASGEYMISNARHADGDGGQAIAKNESITT